MADSSAPVTELPLNVLMPNGEVSVAKAVFWPDYETRYCHLRLEIGDRVFAEKDCSWIRRIFGRNS